LNANRAGCKLQPSSSRAALTAGDIGGDGARSYAEFLGGLLFALANGGSVKSAPLGAVFTFMFAVPAAFDLSRASSPRKIA
jgi:ABC-type spermidine/putrescine transport system permease subunit I